MYCSTSSAENSIPVRLVTAVSRMTGMDRVLTQVVEGGEAVLVGHLDVEDDEGGNVFLGRLEGLDPIGDGDDVEVILQDVAHELD